MLATTTIRVRQLLLVVVTTVLFSTLLNGCKPGAVPKAATPARSTPVRSNGEPLAAKVPSAKSSAWKEFAKDTIKEVSVEYIKERLLQQSGGATRPEERSEREEAFKQIDRELKVSVLEGRAYAGHGRPVRVLGVLLNNRIYVDAEGFSYLAAQINSSTNKGLLEGDVVFAVEGQLLSPGRDLTVLMNQGSTQDKVSLSVLRGKNLLEVFAPVSLTTPTAVQISDRRVQDAAEKIWLESEVKSGAIQKPAWR